MATQLGALYLPFSINSRQVLCKDEVKAIRRLASEPPAVVRLPCSHNRHAIVVNMLGRILHGAVTPALAWYTRMP